MKTFFFLALLLGSTTGVSASGSSGLAGPATTVHYDDLNLAAPIGRAALETRLRRAIRNVCDGPGRKSIEERQRVDACIDEAWKDAVRQIP